MLKKEKGFTLIEMLVVMMIITVLLLLIIPNLSKQSETIDEKGCDALVAVVQAQTDAYYFDKKVYPSSINQLQQDNYITENQKSCNDNSTLTINGGKVSIVKNEI